MKKSQKPSTAKHTALYLTSFVSLVFVLIAMGNISFEAIEFLFPDTVEPWSNHLDQSTLKFAISSLIVASPLFIYITKIINKNLISEELDFNSSIRKWLTYITLFIAGAILTGDLITTIFHYLDGELTIRFILKALTVLLIAGGVFYYYFTDIRSEKPQKKPKVFIIIFLVFVITSFIGALFLADSPSVSRMKKLDSEAVSRINSLKSQVFSFAYAKKRLPENDELKTWREPKNSFSSLKYDLEKFNIRYIKTNDLEYQICARFERDNRKDSELQRPGYWLSEWLHPAGDYCFDLEIDSNQYFGKESLKR